MTNNQPPASSLQPPQLTLHGAWLTATVEADPCFVVWAESEPVPKPSSRRGRTRSPSPEAPRAHPFAADANVLREALSSLAGEPEHVTVVAHLPSRAAAPLASWEELGEEKLALAPWHVPAFAFDPIDTAAFLLKLPEDEQLPRGMRVAADLRFWQLAGRFALELLVGQRFAPDLALEEGVSLAVWKPLLDSEEDQARLAVLVRNMPSASRAITRTAKEAVLVPRALLADFLEVLVDARVSAAANIPAPDSSLGPAARAWLQALASDDPTVKLPAAFVEQFRAWRNAARADTAGGFRICFRLDPPEEASQPRGGQRRAMQRDWRLHYFLQANDDPSLLVPAEQVWQARGRTLRLLDRLFDQPQERMLAGLGLAARMFAPIEESLHDARPTEAALTVEEAYTFLREVALLLRGAGFGVLLPNLAVGLSARARAAPAKKQPKGGVAGLTFDSVIRFDWSLALGGEEISPEEFQRLAALKTPLVQVRGQWVELRPEQAQQALALLQKRGDGMSMAEAVRFALAPEPVAGVPVSTVEVDGVLADVLARLEQPARLEQVPVPAGLHASLRHYQQAGMDWLHFLHELGFGACLADDMGLGKTLQTIAFLLHLREVAGNREQGTDNSPTTLPPSLVVCPTSVVGNWRRELERFAPELRVLVHHGAERERENFAEHAIQHDVVVSAYPLLYRDEALFDKLDWSVLVLDEAQNIKNPDTRQAQAARKLRATHRVALTGTPVENRLAELWSIFHFLNPGYLGTAGSFQRQFARPIEREQDANAAKRLRSITGPFILRRVKTDPAVISDLPAKNEMKTYCTLTREQATLYQAVVRESLEQLDRDDTEGMRRRSVVLTTLMRLKQVCNHPAQYLADGSPLPDRSGKLARLVEMLDEARATGERALIFTQFAEMGALLQLYLRSVFGEEPLYLHGGTPAKQREPMVRRFQEDERGPLVFILSIKAGGTGLTLTRANHVFHYDRWWNPAVENQATDRAFRIGQKRNVQVYKYICLGTVEERIDEMIERKQALADQIVGTSEDWITELSTEQLRDIFTLRSEAVE